MIESLVALTTIDPVKALLVIFVSISIYTSYKYMQSRLKGLDNFEESMNEWKKLIESHTDKTRKQLDSNSKTFTETSLYLSKDIIELRSAIADVKKEFSSFMENLSHINTKTSAIGKEVSEMNKEFGRVIVLEEYTKKQEEVNVQTLKNFILVAEKLKDHKERILKLTGK